MRASVELDEIKAIRRLLINLLRPVATGKPMPEKTFAGELGTGACISLRSTAKAKAFAATRTRSQHQLSLRLQAGSLVTALLGASQIQMITKEVEQGHTRVARQIDE